MTSLYTCITLHQCLPSVCFGLDSYSLQCTIRGLIKREPTAYRTFRKATNTHTLSGIRTHEHHYQRPVLIRPSFGLYTYGINTELREIFLLSNGFQLRIC